MKFQRAVNLHLFKCSVIKLPRMVMHLKLHGHRHGRLTHVAAGGLKGTCDEQTTGENMLIQNEITAGNQERVFYFPSLCLMETSLSACLVL